MTLGSTQSLVKMSTRNIPGGKSGRCVRLTTSPPSCAECHAIWEPKPPGTLWTTPDLLRDCFTFNSQKARCAPHLKDKLVNVDYRNRPLHIIIIHQTCTPHYTALHAVWTLQVHTAISNTSFIDTPTTHFLLHTAVIREIANEPTSEITYDIFVKCIGLTPGGSSTIHIYTQTIHRTTQWNRIPRTERT